MVLAFLGCLVVSAVCAQQKADSLHCDEMYVQTIKKIETKDPCLFISTEYILSQPLHQRTTLYDLYMRFIQTWMDKTPDFTFNLNNKILDLCKGDNLSLFDVYLTCLTRAALKEKKANSALAIQLFAAYLKKPENKVKQTNKVKKLIRDVEENQLESYL